MSSAPYIRTGAMRHRAELQSRTLTPDGYGGNSVAWTTERSLWCQIRPTSGSERMQAMRLQSSVTHEIYCRYADDITADKRLVHDDVAYNIRAVRMPENRKEFLHLIAESGVAT